MMVCDFVHRFSEKTENLGKVICNRDVNTLEMAQK